VFCGLPIPAKHTTIKALDTVPTGIPHGKKRASEDVISASLEALFRLNRLLIFFASPEDLECIKDNCEYER
jgi:hypothetical protein